MSAADLLELPEVRAQYSPISIKQYHEYPLYNERGHRTELVRGVILEKVAKSPLHASIATRLGKLLLAQTPVGYTIRLDQPLTLHDSEPEPDLAIVLGSDDDYLVEHPRTAALVVEVAVTSLGLDRKKADVYAEAEVAEYWIIIGRERRVEVYRKPENGKYSAMESVEFDGHILCESLPGVTLSLAALPKIS